MVSRSGLINSDIISHLTFLLQTGARELVTLYGIKRKVKTKLLFQIWESGSFAVLSINSYLILCLIAAMYIAIAQD
jgi:hypothetical protein